ncbi:MAG: 1-acyl-sn-glycerol-3-phosphate acyltransferase [Clostridia bacterium]|nr:1-acyl-sn-glycerol-3-phosphate acyltransferase [Clostridia bacterium]
MKGKAIIVSNHIEIWDYAAMMFAFPTRTLRCVVAEVMYDNSPLMAFFLHILGAIKVNRDIHDFEFISKCNKILSRGGVVNIYPEAKVNKENNNVRAFSPSTVYLALESGAPIIPVYTSGKYFKKEKNRLIIGQPFYARELYNDELSQAENITAITEKLRQTIIQLQNEIEKK